MNKNCFHVSDEDLLLAADGELPERRSAQVQAHLGSCWACRARMAEIERTIGEVVRLTRESSGPEVPPIDGARARLKARLSELVQNSHPNSFWRLHAGLTRKGFVYGLALLFLFTLGARSLYQKIRAYKDQAHGVAYAAALPNRVLTPGATQPVSLASMCSSEHDQVVRTVSEELRQRVFREYGIAGARLADYEVDHLVTPGLGGSDDIRNLCPEPRYQTLWNSYVKDQLEDHLHYLVCNRRVALAVAQHDPANDWISAYRKYFHSDAPLLPRSTSGD